MVLVKVVSKSHSQNVVEVKGQRQRSNDLQNVTIKTLPVTNNNETTAISRLRILRTGSCVHVFDYQQTNSFARRCRGGSLFQHRPVEDVIVTVIERTK